MRARILVVVASVSVVAGVLTSGTAGAAGTKPPSHDAYVESADSICEKSTKRIDGVVEDLGLSPSDDEARDAVGAVVVLFRKQVDRLRSLTPPRDEERRVERVYRAVERAIDRVETKPSSLFDEPSPFARAARLAERYGFEECGQG
jgi:hypothetical protein